MKCISSPALDDAQIMQYMEGEGDDTVASHIRECSYCREKVTTWTRLQNRLQKQLYRVSCPAPMELGDYHLRLLPAPQALVIAQHVRECPLCKRELAELEDFLADPDAQPGFFGAVKVLVARLINQPEMGHAGVALRGEAKGPLILEAEGIVITLDIQPGANDQVSLLGQLAAADQDQWTGAEVQLQQTDSSQRAGLLDDLGAFRFDQVHPGVVQIAISSLHGITVQIPRVDIAV